MDLTGLNNSRLKRRNRGLILKLIATQDHSSRVDLARESKLSKMSVTNIVTEMIESGFVQETGTAESDRVGRNPIELSIAPGAPKLVGLLIDRAVIGAVLCDFHMNVLAREEVRFQSCDSDTLQKIIFLLLDNIIGQGERVLGIGVGTVGPVDLRSGTILNPPNFHGITNVPIISILRERYRLPAFIDNQCNAAAVAEQYYGVGNPFNDFIYVAITHGIGSGIISNGRLLRNASGLSSEIGHMSIDYAGNPCSCGNRGCLEAYIGTITLCQRAKSLTGESLSFKEICERDGTPPFDSILDDMITKLACALIGTVNLLNPQAIILGHEGYWLPDRRLAELESEINARKISQAHHVVSVLRPHFAEDTILIGCAAAIAVMAFEGRDLSALPV